MRLPIIFFILCIVFICSYSQGQAPTDTNRVGICDLQEAFSSSDPDYVRIIQAKNANNNKAVQWADIEPQQGVYDFSGLDKALKQIHAFGRKAVVKLNGNNKPQWLFDVVPFNPKENPPSAKKGILMYWHPTFIDAYINLLKAYGHYLDTCAYTDIISGVRLNFNARATEMFGVGSKYKPLDQWIVPEGVDPESLEIWNDDVDLEYKDIIVQAHIDHILPYAFVYARTNLEDFIVNKHIELFENSEMGFFHTGASMEQNQVFGNTHRYSRFIEFSRKGQAPGLTEMAGIHQYRERYTNPYPLVQWVYWRLLSDLHCGVSMSGFHAADVLKDNYGKSEYDLACLFADPYLGKHASPKEAPGAWVALRGKGDKYSGDYRYLMEREGDVPTAPLVDNYPGINDGSIEKTRVGSTDKRFGSWARALPAGKSMTFHLNPEVFSAGEKRIARVVYFDGGKGNWQLLQGDSIKMKVSNTASGKWIEKQILIETDGNTYKIENTGSENVIFHMLEVKRYSASDNSLSVKGVSIDLQPDSVLVSGSSHQLAANVYPSSALNTAVSWNSSNESVASVDQNGLVTALSEGETTISATTQDGNFNADFVLQVEDQNSNIKYATCNSGIHVFPNPAGKKLHFRFPTRGSEKKISISNMLGQHLLSKTARGMQTEIDISHLNAEGFLIVGVHDGSVSALYKIMCM